MGEGKERKEKEKIQIAVNRVLNVDTVVSFSSEKIAQAMRMNMTKQ